MHDCWFSRSNSIQLILSHSGPCLITWFPFAHFRITSNYSWLSTKFLRNSKKWNFGKLPIHRICPSSIVRDAKRHHVMPHFCWVDDISHRPTLQTASLCSQWSVTVEFEWNKYTNLKKEKNKHCSFDYVNIFLHFKWFQNDFCI